MIMLGATPSIDTGTGTSVGLKIEQDANCSFTLCNPHANLSMPVLCYICDCALCIDHALLATLVLCVYRVTIDQVPQETAMIIHAVRMHNSEPLFGRTSRRYRFCATPQAGRDHGLEKHSCYWIPRVCQKVFDSQHSLEFASHTSRC